jgi:hypothetical protein
MLKRWAVVYVLLVVVDGLVGVWVVVYVFRLCIGCLCRWLRSMWLFLCVWEVVFWFCWCVTGFGSAVVGAYVRVVSWGLRVLFPRGMLWGTILFYVTPR